jgi:hypothetical protein
MWELNYLPKLFEIVSNHEALVAMIFKNHDFVIQTSTLRIISYHETDFASAMADIQFMSASSCLRDHLTDMISLRAGVLRRVHVSFFYFGNRVCEPCRRHKMRRKWRSLLVQAEASCTKMIPHVTDLTSHRSRHIGRGSRPVCFAQGKRQNSLLGVTNMCHPPRLFHHHRPAQPVKHATNNP